MMNIGFYCGSFDPFTNGHLHVVKEASKLFDLVYVGIGINVNKKRWYERDVMEKAIKQCLKDENLNNVKVITYEGLSVECAKKLNANYLIRGIRNGMDYQYEENLAQINEELSGIDTIYLRAGDFGFVSSSFVRDLINNKMDISKYAPKSVIEVIKR